MCRNIAGFVMLELPGGLYDPPLVENVQKCECYLDFPSSKWDKLCHEFVSCFLMPKKISSFQKRTNIKVMDTF